MIRRLSLLLILLVTLPSASLAQDRLAQDFANPPDSARPQVWWHWLAGNVSKEGITADLEAMKNAGIGGGTIANISFDQEGSAPFLSPAWWSMIRHAVQEANRLGLQLGFFNCEGWSSSGGPWITPDSAMQMLVWSERRFAGPAAGAVRLSQPFTRLGYYRDAAVIAFPTPASESQPTLRELNPQITDSDGRPASAAAMFDGDAATAYTIPAAPGRKPFLQFTFNRPFTASMLRLLPGPLWSRGDFELQVSTDGASFRPVRSFSMPGSFLDSGTEWMTSGSFPAVTGRVFRLVFPGPEAMSIAEFDLLGPSATTPTPVSPQSILDLTGKLEPSGQLNWTRPPGSWTVLRFGYTPIGVHNHPVTPFGDGLECDKLSRAALKKHFAAFVDRVIDAAGPLAGKTLAYSLIDSYECGEQNWAAAMPAEFRARVGYDIRPWLPVLAGRVIESPAAAARFMEDFQQTIADLWSSNYYGCFAELLHQRGLRGSVEAYGNGDFDNLRSAGLNDMPMSEFWFGNADDGGLAKQAASAAHTYGRPIVGAESFTSGDLWNFDPWNMKIEGDWIFSKGVNRYYFHSYAQQPWVDGRRPGMVWGNGVHLTRNLTWWAQAKPWLRYIARCQYLLQSGKFVADILSYQGEGVNHFDGDPRPLKNPPPGYDFDGVDTQMLQALTVQNGRLSLPSGMQYRLLVLPDQSMISPAVLRRVRDLVRAGAAVFGRRPTRAFGRSGLPGSNLQVRTLAAELWGTINGKEITAHHFGAGTVYWTGSYDNLQPALKALRIQPDFVYDAGDAQVRFLHRRIGGADAYFVSNQEPDRVEAVCTFRIRGRQPELWDPETGAVRPAAIWRATADGRTAVPLDFAPGQSDFVVFRNPPRQDHLVSVAHAASLASRVPAHTLTITRAVYVADDAQGGTLDATQQLAAAVRNGTVRARATNAYFGSDPAPLHVKHLEVSYVYDGRPANLRVPENALLRIPESSTADTGPAYEISPGITSSLAAWQPGDYRLTWASGRVKRWTAPPPGSLTLAGSWTVRFDPHGGGPGQVVFNRLVDWTRRPEDGIRHYSGTAIYSKVFTVPANGAAGGKVVMLDLGQLKDLAGLRLNGHDLGIVWKPPFRVDVSRWIRPGPNNLEVFVTNLWANRLIGDSALPANQRVAFTTHNPYHPDSPLQESGLLGPVTLQFTTPEPLLNR